MTTDTTHDRQHLPTPEFREFMDWELQRAFGRHRLHRRLRLAAIIVASLGVGVTAGLAPAQVRQDSARDSLLMAAEADLRLAQVRLDVVRAQLEKDQKLVEVGMLRSTSSTAMQARELEAEVARIQADMEEIRATGQSPRDELNAPTVNGRDFVSRRVGLRLASAEARLRAAEQSFSDVERLARVGAVSQVRLLEARAAIMSARKDLAVLAEKMSLRREFLQKGTPVDQLVQRLERTELQQDIAVAESQVQLARERVSAMEKARSVGTVDELEVMRANLELRERELEMRRLTIRLRAVPRLVPPRSDTSEAVGNDSP